MSRWDDQFEGHPVSTALARARDQIEAIGEHLADAAQVEEQARLARVVEYVQSAVKATDPELVPIGVLDQIANTADQITTYLTQFTASPDAVLLANANGQADALLQQVLALAPRIAPEDVQDLQSAVSSFRRSVGQHLRNVEAEVATARSGVDSVSSALAQQQEKITAQNARLDSVVTEYQAQFSQFLAQRQAEATQVLDERREELRAAIADSGSKVDEITGEAKAALDELLEVAKTANQDALDAEKARADAQYEELGTRGQEGMNQLEELLARAVKTVGAIGSTALAGGYKIVADAECKAANFWRWVAALSLLGAISATVFAVVHGVIHGLSAQSFFEKWAISIPFAALAAYAGFESSRHREQERMNRKIELQLASLDAYLATLPQDRQDQIRANLANRFFGDLPAPPKEPENED